MAYNISATCRLGRILTRRTIPQRALKQARDYRRLGYSDISITDLESGDVYDAAGLAAKLQVQAVEKQSAG